MDGGGWRRGLMRATLWGAIGCLCCVAARGEKVQAEKPQPHVLVAAPCCVAAGATTRLVLRGLQLDQASEVRLVERGGTVRLLSQDKAPLPAKQDANRVGDTQVEIELSLALDAAPGTVSLEVVTPQGTTNPFSLLVLRPEWLLAEREPNGGLAEAMPLEPGISVVGTIQEPRDVDVYCLQGQAGQRFVVDVAATRIGSGLDALLLILDERAQTLAECDDIEGGTDARLELTLAANGRFFLVVMDANDLGGPASVYKLIARRVD